MSLYLELQEFQKFLRSRFDTVFPELLPDLDWPPESTILGGLLHPKS
jgi:hypothetical protein